MPQVRVPSFIVVDKSQPKRIIAILDEALAAWWKQNFPAFDVIEIPLYFGIYTDFSVGCFEYMYTKEGHFFLTEKPSNLSLAEAYQIILNK